MPENVTSRPKDVAARINLKPGIYSGASVAALFLLAPYLRQFLIFAYVLGPLAGVWYEIRRRRISLDFNQGALIGFYSAFYGSIAALAFHEIVVRVVVDKLWRPEKLYLLPPLLAGKGLNSDTPIGWYILMLELTVMAILAAILGVPSGLLAVKLFRPRRGVGKGAG